MANPGGANRIELESQILCTALRQSRADTDTNGLRLASQGLSQLYPDLLPSEVKETPPDYYELLQIDCDVNPSLVLAAYLKSMKQFLRTNPDPKVQSAEYYNLLNAGLILRQSRLRISHDLILARKLLTEERSAAKECSFEPTNDDYEEHKILSTTRAPLNETMPLLIELLVIAQFIGPGEVQALENQMGLYPDIPLVDLVLQAGYVTELELKSLQLAEYFLSRGQLTMRQFAVSMFDQKQTGTNPSWWPRGCPPEDPFEPLAESRVPKRPYPPTGSGEIELPWPEPDAGPESTE